MIRVYVQDDRPLLQRVLRRERQKVPSARLVAIQHNRQAAYGLFGQHYIQNGSFKEGTVNDWKLLGSKIVFDKFMQVEERTYEMPDGKTKNFYIKITNPAICVLALTEDNKVITVEQFRPDSAKDKYAGTWAIRQLFDEGDD